MSLSFKIWIALSIQSLIPVSLGTLIGLLLASNIGYAWWLLPASMAVVTGFDAVLAEAEARDRSAS